MMMPMMWMMETSSRHSLEYDAEIPVDDAMREIVVFVAAAVRAMVGRLLAETYVMTVIE